MAFTLLGDITQKSPIYKHESHKLHQAFNLAVDADRVDVGDIVLLDQNGFIQSLKDITGLELQQKRNILGCAITESTHPAYQESEQRGAIEVTVAVKGYMIIWGWVDGALRAGPVLPSEGVASTTERRQFFTADTSTDPPVALNLTPVDGGGEHFVQILILN